MVAEVIIDLSSDGVDKIFDYNADDGITVGSRVVVSFLNRKMQGYVISVKEHSDYEGKLKDIEEVLDEGVIGGDLLKLMDFMTAKYNLRRIDVLHLYLPPNMRDGKVKELKRKFVTLNPEMSYDEICAAVGKNRARQTELVEVLSAEGEFLSNLTTLYGSTVKTLIAKNLLSVTDRAVRRAPNGGIEAREEFTLTPDQKKCFEEITVSDGGKFLLHGVTGSGKTEVYMRAIEASVKRGKTAVMLVPEISLTAQFYKLFKSRFFDEVAIIHSGLSAGERFDEWVRIMSGEARIVIGARSAIFSPLKNIGVIIVDEEHDGSYISESNPRYDAKEVAAFRAEQCGAALVLGSATPSVDTYYEMCCGKYRLLSMPKRINEKCLPEIEIVDMCREIKLGNTGLLSGRLERALGETLKNGNQAMIYLNRRGHSSFVMCRECGYVAKCSECDISLTYHIEEDKLKCHYCGKKFYMITECPECGGKNLRYGKTGTEKVARELHRLFPEARILRMDNDTTREKDGYDKILGAFYRKEADILVGTQMIAKGHDFSDVT
ncbi:MAG: primosomal protein N', partial [Clostridiales bacterium]|nr:primosomal protein N' [Clostridiales bacterium]